MVSERASALLSERGRASERERERELRVEILELRVCLGFVQRSGFGVVSPLRALLPSVERTP